MKMLASYFLLLFVLFSFVAEASPNYYMLDNETPATINDLIDDPLLVIRSKPPGHELTPYNLALSWEYYAQVNATEELLTLKRPAPLSQLKGQHHAYVEGTDPDQPRFAICTDLLNPQCCWWQISKDPEFQHSPLLQEITGYQDIITMHPLEETVLSPDHLYYFRVRVSSGEQWSQWSEPHPFVVTKPDSITDARFTRSSNGTFHLEWSPSSDQGMRYHVFASHSKDFIPSLYTNFHLLSEDNSDNLIKVTTECRVEIDPTYPYYRVIAEKDGLFSIPSAIINIWDRDLSPDRNVVTVVDGKAVRVPIPNSYPDLEDDTKAYWPHPYIKKSIWKKVKHHVLPENHPAKERLDRIFKKSRAILNIEKMKKAGFSNPKPRKYTHLVVVKHPDLEGYIIKTYLDAQRLYKRKLPYYYWLLRIQGVNKINKAIDQRGWRHLFKVPKKWIYPLPPEPSPPKEFQRKNFILIEEDMDILTGKENNQMWGSAVVTTSLIDKVYSIIEELGLSDCAKPDNIPFSRDGKIAFVDTQTFDTWPVRYDKLTPFLSPQMKKYWKQLIKKK